MEEIIQEALIKGVEMHVAGEFEFASQLYGSVIKLQPNHADANHNMGLLKVDTGNDLEALSYLQTALEADTSISQFWLSYIKGLIKLDRMDEATKILCLAKENGAEVEEFLELDRQLKVPPAIDVIENTREYEIAPAKPNILDTLKLDKALRLAKQKTKEGSSEEAKLIYQDILNRFPKNRRAINGMKALSGRPVGKAPKVKEPSQDQLQPIINLYSQRQFQHVLKEASQLLQQFPSSVTLYNISGAANGGLGLLDAAIEAYNKALSIKPDYADAYFNMGIALKDQDKLEEAIEAYNKALAIKPDYAAAYFNMGDALTGMVFRKQNPDIQKTIKSILDHKNYVRPKDIFPAIISLLKFEPLLLGAFEQYSKSELTQSIQETVSNLSELPLLLKSMSICPLADLELEVVLADIRYGLLSAITELVGSPEVLRFQSALALQCFTNEYVYSYTDDEAEAVQSLENLVEKTLAKGQKPSPHSVLCLASYKALHEYAWCDLLTITNNIEDVFTRQVLEPRQENCLKSDIPALQEITDKVSSKVREQYEENPYPRWVSLRLRLEPASISEITEEVKLKLSDHAVHDIEAPDILIAGCGTGQHSIGTAVTFKNSKILALDLSLSSLAYAKRKTKELGVQNIEYMHADILDLGKLNKQFDIIESGGVLHHMNNPMVGWRVLTKCLKPGGLMKIGLYSEFARQHIVKMREEINQSSIGSSDIAMKSFRNELINSDKEHHKRILSSPDFYSMSSLRDLLFHVQEHRFTIPQIKDCLVGLGLSFCGFEADKIVQNFKITNTGADDSYNLDKWSSYEKANPSAFAGMYQFWCQKVA